MRIDMTLMLDEDIDYQACSHRTYNCEAFNKGINLRLTTEQARALWVELAKNLRRVKEEEKC